MSFSNTNAVPHNLTILPLHMAESDPRMHLVSCFHQSCIIKCLLHGGTMASSRDTRVSQPCFSSPSPFCSCLSSSTPWWTLTCSALLITPVTPWPSTSSRLPRRMTTGRLPPGNYGAHRHSSYMCHSLTVFSVWGLQIGDPIGYQESVCPYQRSSLVFHWDDHSAIYSRLCFIINVVVIWMAPFATCRLWHSSQRLLTSVMHIFCWFYLTGCPLVTC